MAGSATSGAKILLVEDNEVQAMVAKEFLQKNGCEVFWVQYAAEAIKAALATPPDVILLDLILPDMNGKEVCRWLKGNGETKSIPIIMLTASNSLDDRISGIEAGADDYLTKPYDVGELRAKIYAALRTKALQDELRKKNRQLSELLRKVEELAITDSLTGLFNRRHIETILDREWKRSRRYNQCMTIGFIDIDHFKAVNDAFGHKAGDAVLKEFSDVLRKSLRDVDFTARWGGEEFLAVLPCTDRQQGTKVAARLLNDIASHRFRDTGQHAITVSIGLASSDLRIDGWEKLIDLADNAMYEAKRDGRNRVGVAREDSLLPLDRGKDRQGSPR